MGRSATHPLAHRASANDLGRYGRNGPVLTDNPRRPASPVPPPSPGEHVWILLRWNVLTAGQAHQLAQGRARVEPKDPTLIACQVGCYWCHQGYDQVNERCPAFDEQPEEPTDEPTPLDPAPEEAVPVDPPTPPDAGPPAVELEVQPDLAVEVDPLAQPMTETNLTVPANQR